MSLQKPKLIQPGILLLRNVSEPAISCQPPQNAARVRAEKLSQRGPTPRARQGTGANCSERPFHLRQVDLGQAKNEVLSSGLKISGSDPQLDDPTPILSLVKENAVLGE